MPQARTYEFNATNNIMNLDNSKLVERIQRNQIHHESMFEKQDIRNRKFRTIDYTAVLATKSTRVIQ